jgi:hypothetical protein
MAGGSITRCAANRIQLACTEYFQVRAMEYKCVLTKEIDIINNAHKELGNTKCQRKYKSKIQKHAMVY